MFKVGDKIRYGFFVGLTIVGEDELHFILKDTHGNEKKVYKSIVDKHGKLES